MSFSKKMLAFAAVTALSAATAVPAMALENEFHGMFKFMGYQSNVLVGDNGTSTGASANKNPYFLTDDAHSGFYSELRSRILYTAKANDNLKLVTHFEFDARFGGGDRFDAAKLDADQAGLEIKNVYLDFNCPITGTNVKAGIQPWGDAYGSLFLAADMSGLYATKKMDAFTASLGWFRFDEDTSDLEAADRGPGQQTADLIVLDGKFAMNKDMTFGASYYNIQNDVGAATAPYELFHMLGVNADLKVGPATVKPFAAYQFGEVDSDSDISAFLLGATGKVKAGPGTVNLAAFYMSGDKSATGTSDQKGFQTVAKGSTYFNPANMWLLVRPNQAAGTSTSVLGNDMTAGGRGTTGLFAGYEGAVDKMFYNANIGYMMTNKERGSEDDSIGTEINAQAGYKLYDNLSASAAAAYLFAGDYLGNVDDPYLINLQLSYTF